MSDSNAWYFRVVGDVVGSLNSNALRELTKTWDADTSLNSGSFVQREQAAMVEVSH